MRALLWIRFRYLLAGWHRTLHGEDGKRRPWMAVLLGLALLYIAVILIAGVTWLFLQMSVFAEMGLDWVYFAFAFLLGGALALFGSVYTTQNHLYNARDNELLLAMPVRMEHICLSRVIFLLLGTAGYMALVTLPAFVVYWIRFGMTFGGALGYLVLFCCMVLLCQTISCLFGWLLHLLLAKIPGKAVGSLLFMTLFLTVYFWVYSHIMSQFEAIIGQFASYGTVLADFFSRWGWFFLQIGHGCLGQIGSVGIVLLITAGITALGYLFLIATFRSSLLTRKAQGSYRTGRTALKMRTPVMAVCAKEARRFFTSSVYLTNMGVGIVLALIFTAGGALFRDRLLEPFAGFGEASDVILVSVFYLLFGFLLSMTMITAPSISLEGRSLWILGSMPIDGGTILRGKLLFHILATVPVSVISALILGFVYGIPVPIIFCMILYAASVPLVSGLLGLVLNLRFPRFDWLNEAYPCKQSLAVGISMFVMMGMSMLTFGLYILGAYLASGLGITSAMLAGSVMAVLLLLLLSAVLALILHRWGRGRMEELLRQ